MPKLTARDIKERSNNLRIISETPASVNIKTIKFLKRLKNNILMEEKDFRKLNNYYGKRQN